VRENRTHGSEGGEGNLPDPYRFSIVLKLAQQDEIKKAGYDSIFIPAIAIDYSDIYRDHHHGVYHHPVCSRRAY